MVAPFGLGSCPSAPAMRKGHRTDHKMLRFRLFLVLSSGHKQFLGTIAGLEVQPHLVDSQRLFAAIPWAPRCTLLRLPLSGSLYSPAVPWESCLTALVKISAFIYFSSRFFSRGQTCVLSAAAGSLSLDSASPGSPTG